MNKTEYAVLDDGFVRYIAHMGDDDSIANAARVSYAAGTKTKRDNEQLVRFLMRHQHYSPFGQCQFQVHLRLPIYVHNQFIRHRAFTWNMMSGRYSIMPDEKWTPKTADLRGQGTGNKQVGNGNLSNDPEVEPGTRENCQSAIETAYEEASITYTYLLENGLCREQARTVLPMGQYTEGVVTANLGEWMLLLRQRLDPHAQEEIRVYAVAIAAMLEELFPVAMQAFYDYQLNAVTFSGAEIALLRGMLQDQILELNADPNMRQALLGERLPSQRERQEFWRKINGKA
jgi:thymidylate synthase (FAD)